MIYAALGDTGVIVVIVLFVGYLFWCFRDVK